MELVTLFLFLIAFTKADHPGHDHHHGDHHHHHEHDEKDHGHEDHPENDKELENIGGKLTLPNLKDCTNSKFILPPEKFSFSRKREAITINSFFLSGIHHAQFGKHGIAFSNLLNFLED